MKKKLIAMLMSGMVICGASSCSATSYQIETPITQTDKAAKIKELSKGLKAFHGDFEDVTIYHYDAPLALWTYVADKKSTVCKLEVEYQGHGWVFMNGVTIKTDNNKYTLKLSNVSRDVIYGDIVREAASYEIDDSMDEDMLNDIINSSSVMIRYDGEKYATAKISKRALDKMNTSLNLFKYIKS